MSDPVIIKRGLLDRNPGKPSIEIQQRYVPNADGSPDQFAARDMTIARAMMRVLQFYYRGHFWEVTVDSKQGIAWITIPLLLGDWKYVLKMNKDILPEDVKRAGGEILERFKIPRSDIDIGAFVAAKPKIMPRYNTKPPA